MTLQDILKIELQSSSTKKLNSSSINKLSKRIHKKRSDTGKKNLQDFLAPSNSVRKRNSIKKNSLSSTNLKGNGSQIKRKKSEDINILLELKEEDLAISINSESRLDLSETSVCSLEDYERKVHYVQNGKLLIRN